MCGDKLKFSYSFEYKLLRSLKPYWGFYSSKSINPNLNSETKKRIFLTLHCTINPSPSTNSLIIRVLLKNVLLSLLLKVG